MSEDWAKKYVEERKQKREEKQREEQDARARRSHAEAGASGKFHQIRKQIEQDVRTLNNDPSLQSAEFTGFSDREFLVAFRGMPGAEVKVSLNGLLIRCDYALFPKGDPRREPNQMATTLRICSDLDGVITVHKNGGEETFTDAEASRFVLLPVLSHIAD